MGLCVVGVVPEWCSSVCMWSITLTTLKGPERQLLVLVLSVAMALSLALWVASTTMGMSVRLGARWTWRRTARLLALGSTTLSSMVLGMCLVYVW